MPSPVGEGGLRAFASMTDEVFAFSSSNFPSGIPCPDTSSTASGPPSPTGEGFLKSMRKHCISSISQKLHIIRSKSGISSTTLLLDIIHFNEVAYHHSVRNAYHPPKVAYTPFGAKHLCASRFALCSASPSAPRSNLHSLPCASTDSLRLIIITASPCISSTTLLLDIIHSNGVAYHHSARNAYHPF